ncbi:hypothetical protein PsorP6_015369 [Peronosclerospora sorghi]|uniref:Uncharacterized protein n=1 Tax=Peronosclerospora sorghi TaxID=230839 RepID=A0ACC0WNF7_9STRA|nr:hypothetical protein PsorP6_015369 [Peronosclerospora sorghi]
MLDNEKHRQHRLDILQRMFMVLLLVNCIITDYFLSHHEKLEKYKLVRHLLDSLSHCCVGFCSWAVFLFQIEKMFEARSAPFSNLSMIKKCLLNGITASLLDIDHFIAAGSFSLTGAVHLDNRPFGHAVTFIIVVAILVNWCSRKYQARRRRYCVCFIVIAWFSHQIRDGIRRGLWFWPFQSTRRVNYLLYLLMEEGLPFLMAKWWIKAPTLTEIEKMELAIQKVDEKKEVDKEDERQISADVLGLMSPTVTR